MNGAAVTPTAKGLAPPRFGKYEAIRFLALVLFQPPPFHLCGDFRVSRARQFAEGETKAKAGSHPGHDYCRFGGGQDGMWFLRQRDLGVALLAATANFSQIQSGSQLGNLYPPIQAIADASPLELSFLRPDFRIITSGKHLAGKEALLPPAL
jgi:hypothetical protein